MQYKMGPKSPVISRGYLLALPPIGVLFHPSHWYLLIFRPIYRGPFFFAIVEADHGHIIKVAPFVLLGDILHLQVLTFTGKVDNPSKSNNDTE